MGSAANGRFGRAPADTSRLTHPPASVSRPLTVSACLRYALDNTMARGPVVLIGWLLLASLALTAVFTAVVVVAGLDPARRGVPDVAWAGLMRAMDAGAMGGDERSGPSSTTCSTPRARRATSSRPLSFYTVVEAAQRRRQAAIGYRVQAQAHDAAAAFGVAVNPDKAVLVTFAADDRVIVLAED